MNKKTKKHLFTFISCVFASGIIISLATRGNVFTETSASVHGSTCSWNHYKEVTPTYNNPGVREYWICCDHNELGPSYSLPTVGKISEANHPSNFVNTLTTSDNRYLAPYKETISFEDGFVPSIFTKQDKISSLEVATGGSDGNNALKVTVTGSDYRLGISKKYLDEVFSDPSIVEINFDVKSTTATSNFRYGTSSSHPTYEANLAGYGVEKGYKTFAFKRAYYQTYIDGFSFIYGGGLSSGDYLLIDNIRPVKEPLTSYGFESGRLVSKTVSGYENKASFRYAYENKEFFITDGSTITDYGFDYSIKSEGNRSLKITKSTGYLSFTLGNIYGQLGSNNVISFDLYSDISINIKDTSNFIDGLNNNSYMEESHPANEWVSYSITKNQMNSSGRFLIIQGTTAGNFYFDNFRITTLENGGESYKNYGQLFIEDQSQTSLFGLSDTINSIVSVTCDGSTINGVTSSSNNLIIPNSSLTRGDHELIVTYVNKNKIYTEHIYVSVVVASKASPITISSSYMSNDYYEYVTSNDIYRMTCNDAEIPFEVSTNKYLIPVGALIQQCIDESGNVNSKQINVNMYSLNDVTVQPFNMQLTTAASKTLPTFDGKGILTHAYSSTSSYMNKTNYTQYANVGKLSEFANTGIDIIYEQALHIGTSETSICPAIRYELDNAAIVGKKVMLCDDALAAMSRMTTSLIGTQLTIGSTQKYFNNTSELDSYVRSRLEILLAEPNCFGISVGDEQSYEMLCGGFGDVLQSIHRVLKAVGREDFYVNTNLNPMNAAFDMLAGPSYTGDPTKDYLTYLEKYVEVSGNNYIQYDIYPLMDTTRTIGGALYDSNGNMTKEGYGIHNFGLRQLMLTTYVCKKYNLDLYVVSQTITYNSTRILNPIDIAWINNMIVGFGARHLSWFVYQVRANTGSETWLDNGSFLGKEGNKNPIYYYMQGMIAQIKNFSNVISSFTYDWSRLYRAKTYTDAWFYSSVLDSSFKSYYSTSASYGHISSVSVDSEQAIVTGLIDRAGRYMYMIQNGHNHPTNNIVQTVTITANAVYSYALVYEAGTPRIMTLGSTGISSWKKSTLTLKLSSGRAAYVMFF